MPAGPRTHALEALRREDAVALFRAGLEAVDPEPLVSAAVETILRDGSPKGRVLLLGAGKASFRMLDGVWKALPGLWETGWRRSVQGLVALPEAVVPCREGPWGRVELVQAGHPVPDERSVQAGKGMLALAGEAGPQDLVLALLSGGASSLMAVPAEGVSLAELAESSRLMLAGGLSIEEMNSVRTHLSVIAGGRLALATSPARTVCLVVSDVPGDDLAVVGSGPLYGDRRAFEDCLETLHRRGVSLPLAAQSRLEAGARGLIEDNPAPGDARLAHVEHQLLANNLRSCRAMAVAAERRGYRSVVLSDRLQGQAREPGPFLAAMAWSAAQSNEPLAPPCALISGGETTVRVTGSGSGGRNQETVVSAIPMLDGLPVTFLSAGSDGIDGPTPAAGGLADGASAGRARVLGLDPRRALDDNDCGRFLQRLGDRVMTGPTGTNVADLRVLLVSSGDPGGGESRE